ncbi:MAG: DUF4389 domain-containing protein [Deltaproteobacteria bacterium]|nr:DUF4389 domain-containing protein [Deltaproteobacteria bacterium]
MNETASAENGASRGKIAIRLLFTLLFAMALELVKAALYLSVIFQYVYLLITKTHCEPVRNFGNLAAAYGYRLMRYLTLNDNPRPFPFKEFPQALEAPEEEITFP